MARFVLRRLGFMVLTVFLASVIIFWATEVLPGDVATQVLGRFATQQAKTEQRHQLGLDKPIPVQYERWVSSYVKGAWGTSVSMNEPVRGVILERLRNSLMLALVAFACRIKRRHTDRILHHGVISVEREPAFLVTFHGERHGAKVGLGSGVVQCVWHGGFLGK